MRKVLFVATIGGFVSQFEMNDVKLLQDKEYEVHYAANFENNIYHLEEKIYEKNNIKEHNVPMAKNPFNLLKNFKAYRDIRKIIDSENISLVHCHTPVGGVIARLAAARSKSKPKVIYTAHGFHFYKGAPIKNWCIYYTVEKIMARFTDALVTINKEDYQRAHKFKLRSGGKVYRIPGVGIDTNRFKFEGFYPGFKIVSVSEINKNKNHKIVIDAIKKLIDQGESIYYDIYGKGPNEEYLKEYIKELGLEEYVSLKGYIVRPEEILTKASCFAFPSIREGLGIAALEAMSCGLPVIASDNRGTREYMVDGYNGIVCKSGDAGEYAKAILKLKNSDGLRKAMSGNAIKTAKKFSVARSEEVMKQVYDSIL